MENLSCVYAVPKPHLREIANIFLTRPQIVYPCYAPDRAPVSANLSDDPLNRNEIETVKRDGRCWQLGIPVFATVTRTRNPEELGGPHCGTV